MDLDSTCKSTHPFAFLQIHGVADKTIKIDGGVMNGHAYTSAKETIARVAAANKCHSPSISQSAFTKMDFEPTIAGLETTVENLSGCAAPVLYWRIARGAHSPKLPLNYAEQVLNFLASN
jgi:polyhydroxybutyrate depolymerase